MVLGLRPKRRRGAAVQVNYIVYVQGIMPWPPFPTLSSIHSLLLKWENGNQSSGCLTASVKDSKVEFDESFTLSLTLFREKRAPDKFQKNFLVFSLFEPRRDKATKGQLLGTAAINLADYGIIEETSTISVPLSYKKSYKSTGQAVLFLKLQPAQNNGEESVSGLMKESIDDVAEIDSFTDDDVSTNSSQNTASCSFENSGASPSQTEEDGCEPQKQGTTAESREPAVTSGQQTSVQISTPSAITATASAQILSLKDPPNEVGNPVNDVGNPVNDCAYTLKFPQSNMISAGKNYAVPFVQSLSQTSSQEMNVENLNCMSSSGNSSENELVGKHSVEAMRKLVTRRSNTLGTKRKPVEFQGNTVPDGKLMHIKSVYSSHYNVKQNIFSESDNSTTDARKQDKSRDSLDKVDYTKQSEIIESLDGYLDGRKERRPETEILEEELREAAAVEVGLYSVVAEHGSSKNKVHTSARRLSRFYLYTCKSKFQGSRARAARALVSGLVLISKACGNDVPRLTFWLSNSIMLRAIVSQAIMESLLSNGQCMKGNDCGMGMNLKLPRKSDFHFPIGEEENDALEELDRWEEPETFLTALEKVEDWIFSRIVESIWWQTLTPLMHSAPIKTRSSGSKKNNVQFPNVQEQGNISVEHWKKAFKDSCERLCPIRAGGHECGCLRFLAKLVMEQLVARLDVAMFNAILRESAEEMPTDPVSDPINDPNVLPIPVGKASFGAGVQLKNAIGSWSRWLTDLFGIEDNESPDDDNGLCDGRLESDMPFKPFRILNAFSDLMMLPFEMLADVSTRKEVCPLFGVPLIKRVLSNFIPDEFCPDPIPEAVLAALDSEDAQEDDGEHLTTLPCSAKPPVYSPPHGAALTSVVGEMDKKSYTNDGEFDAWDSPLTSIFGGDFYSSPSAKLSKGTAMGKRSQNVVRYQLLREVWRASD